MKICPFKTTRKHEIYSLLSMLLEAKKTQRPIYSVVENMK